MNRLSVGLVLAACTVTSAQVGIEAFAPERSYMVMSVPNAAAALDAADRTALRDLWDHPSVQNWFTDTTEAGFGELRAEMDELGIDIDSFSPPVGPVGAAYFFVDETDDEGETWPSVRIVMSADFGDGADAVMDAVWAFLDDWADDDQAIVVEDEYRGATLIEIEWTPEPIGDFDAPGTSPVSGLSISSHLYLAHLDGFLVACDEEGIVERAIDASLGDDVDAIADTDGFQDAIAQHPDDLHAFIAYFLSGDMSSFLVETLQLVAGMNFPGLDVAPIIESLGVLDLRAVGMGVRLDTADAPVETTHGILMTDKRGIISLFDVPDTPFDVPSFVSADAAEIMRLSIRFDEIFPVIDDIVDTLDEQQRAQIRPGLNLVRGQLQPTLEVLGPELFVITRYTRPFDVGSQQTLFAIPVTDELIVGNALTLLGVSFEGMVSARDFEGAAIYETIDGPLELAIGAGYGYLLVGPTESVENALRRAANPGGDTLADEARFQDALGHLGRSMMLGTYMDMGERLAWTRWQIDNELEIFDRMLREGGYPDEMREQMTARREEQLADQPEPPPVDVLLEFLGDVVSEMSVTEDGFRGRALLLEADD